MLGAIVGDIVGSVYEWHNIKTKDFPLFRDDCFFTDDTVMTIAVAEAAYGIPEWIKAVSYLDEPLKAVLRKWRKWYLGNRKKEQRQK